MASRIPFPGQLLTTALVAAALVGCEQTPMDVLSRNRAPRVSISAGPIRDSTDVYLASFNWRAADDDGEVTHFRYAIDDTASTGDWFETDDFELTLLFTAPDSARVDSIFGAGTVPIERYVFNGAHTFFLKAVDDDGAESAPVALSFTAETLAPETRITSPSSTRIVDLGQTFTVRWQGVDFDGTEDPVGYSWRLVAVESVTSMGDEQIEEALLDPTTDGEPWTPFVARTSARIAEVPPGHYVFGVRALDQAGAIEPRMRTFRSPNLANVLLIRASPHGGLPRIRVCGAVKCTTYPTADRTQTTFQIPANASVLFTWEADASDYGGTIAGYSYGIDLDDLADGNPGWSPEGPDQTQLRRSFALRVGDRAREHTLYVRARDDAGGVRIADVNLVVVPLSFDRDVLYVDDWGIDDRGREYPELGRRCLSVSAGGPIPDDRIASSSPIPQDACHDAVLRDSIEDALARLGRGDWVVDRYEPLDPVTGETLDGPVEIDRFSHDYWVLTGPVTLRALARYKLVIWNTRSFRSSELSRMNRPGENNFLAVYLEAGGTAWLMGTGAFSRTRLIAESSSLNPFGYLPDDFPYRFHALRSRREGSVWTEGCFRSSGRTAVLQRRNGFEGAYTSSMASGEGFPELCVSRPPYANAPGSELRGVPSCEAMVVGCGLEINALLAPRGARLDTLYFYRSNAWKELGFDPGYSWMDHGATALRHSGPDAGRLMMWGFPLFYLPDDQIDDVLVAGIRWLLE